MAKHLRPKAGKNLQWVLSGLSETATVEQRATGQPLLSRKQAAELRLLQQLAKSEGKDPRRVMLPFKKQKPALQFLQPARFDMLPPPSSMKAVEVGRAASIAAREQHCVNPMFWRSLGERASELLQSFDTEDMAKLLNGMSRASYVDQELISRLCACALVRIKYFNSRHLIMCVSALSKLRASDDDMVQLFPEFASRVLELRGAGELTMAMATLGRLGNIQGVDDMLHQLAAQVDARLSADQFRVRDLATVCNVYVRLRYLDELHVRNISRCAWGTLHEATPQELARLALAATQARIVGADDVVGRATTLALEKAHFLMPVEIADLMFAFGSALEAGLGSPDTHTALLRLIHEAARLSHQLQPLQLASVLHSCARWKLNAPYPELACLIKILGAKCEKLPVSVARDTLNSIGRLRSQVSTPVSAVHATGDSEGLQDLSHSAGGALAAESETSLRETLVTIQVAVAALEVRVHHELLSDEASAVGSEVAA
mmetsp:Transcript_69540/g.137599  ORF Transcript_69540/g.137599 Transcript_69540/m.137599 type:complete len:489 (-) Transcript_69540:67-1533(-)|eukprot:CAMPEP_0172906084 /NCGR_PEP_ID=MMETSP1075-20121228/176095_1 /TAXON_ID=2916 /ORGANISM="Ceratium fusus, Strain PA161109" /LENGTH=488 /DNA_ID=CAMNT_0013763443 /DNA_START=23 /DNA_END=1489 /DNA_ORIENTATION=-